MIVFICTIFSKVSNFRPKDNWLKISQLNLSVRDTLSHKWKIAFFLGIIAHYYGLNLRKIAIIPKKTCEDAQLGGWREWLRGAGGGCRVACWRRDEGGAGG
jgi:hypothetical protein